MVLIIGPVVGEGLVMRVLLLEMEVVVVEVVEGVNLVEQLDREILLV